MKKILPVIFLLVVSSFLVFYKYSEIPKGLTHDENELARVAFSLENKPYTPFTTVADGHGTPYFYVLLLSFKTFGVNQFALRFPNRIFSVLNVLLFFLIVLTIYKTNIGKKSPLAISYYLLAIGLSLLLLTSRWFLHFSRVSFEMPFLLFTELVSLYFVLVFLTKNVTRYTLHVILILSAIFSGLAFNSYQPGRIFFILPLALLIFKRSSWKKILLFIGAFIIVIIPMSFYLLSHPGNDIRIDQQFFLKNSSLSLEKKAEFLSQNISSTLFMFFTQGDMNGTHNYTGKPALNPILAGFSLIGIFLALKNFRNHYSLMFIIYFLISVVPTILTYPWENPNMLRTYTALPSIVYFCGLTLIAITDLLKKLKFKKLSYLLLITCYLLLFTSVIYELRTYFYYQPLVFKEAFDKPDHLYLIRKNAHINNTWGY